MRRILIVGITAIAIGAVAQTKEESIQKKNDLELQKAMERLKTDAPTQAIQKAAKRLDEAYKFTTAYEDLLEEKTALQREEVSLLKKEADAKEKAAAEEMRDIRRAELESEAVTIKETARKKEAELKKAKKVKKETKLKKEAELKKEADHFVTTVRNAPLTGQYKQAAFQCLDDYNICSRSENSINACASILVICLAKTIIPGAG